MVSFFYYFWASILNFCKTELAILDEELLVFSCFSRKAIEQNNSDDLSLCFIN